MGHALYANSMDMWLDSVLIPNQINQAIEEVEISEEGVAEEILGKDIKTKREINLMSCDLDCCFYFMTSNTFLYE